MVAIKTEMIEFPSNEHSTPGYLAQPAADGPYPAIIAIQEWWGLVPHIKDVAERLAAEGYVVLAPDLYHGAVANEPDEASKLAMALDRDRAVYEIAAAAKALKAMSNVSSQKVGVVGWCMGGRLSLSTAAESDDIGAVIAFYGTPLAAEDVPNLRMPVLGLYAENDGGIPVASVKAFERELQANDIEHEIHIYPGAEHSFFNDTRASYHAEAAKDAWQRALGWFRKHLA